jgi:Tat protein secretion system quality control protein TatD with DNase activity
MTEQQMRMMLEMFTNPAFKQGAMEFMSIAHQQGMEAARKFWGISTSSQNFPDAEKMMESMAEFYKTMGFVPMSKYVELQKELEAQQQENRLLREAIQDLQKRFMSESNEKAQQAWQEIVDKQLEMSREVTKSFFDVLKHGSPKKDN